MTRFFLVVTLVLAGTMARAESRADKVKAINSSFTYLKDRSSLPRYLEGSVSMVMGLTSFLGGFFLAMDPVTPTEEMLVGLTGATIGAITGLDGLVLTFGQPSSDSYTAHALNFPDNGKPKEYGGEVDKVAYGESILKQIADDAFTNRMLRGTADLIVAAGYAFLWTKGERKGATDASGNPFLVGNNGYPKLLGPAIVLGVTGLYKLLIPSREEQAEKKYRDSVPGKAVSEVSVDIFSVPVPEVPYLGLRVRF